MFDLLLAEKIIFVAMSRSFRYERKVFILYVTLSFDLNNELKYDSIDNLICIDTNFLIRNSGIILWEKKLTHMLIDT